MQVITRKEMGKKYLVSLLLIILMLIFGVAMVFSGRKCSADKQGVICDDASDCGGCCCWYDIPIYPDDTGTCDQCPLY